MPLAKQGSFFMDAKIKIGEFQMLHIVHVAEHYSDS